MNEFVVVTGLSGAGRTEFAKNLEDLGWFVIDNLPPALITKVADLAQTPGAVDGRVAFAVRGGTEPEGLMKSVSELRELAERTRLIFLDCADEVLVRRYESSRRPHPFHDDMSLADSIDAERTMLEPIRAEADLVIDTSSLNVHQLRDRLADLFGSESSRPMRTAISSFGFKHGVPLDVDMVLDCRFLPNPHWVEELRPKTGLDDDVRTYVLDQPVSGVFLDHLERLLTMLLPSFVREGKSYLSIAFGCTGGRHRSVAIAEQIAERLRANGVDLVVSHRDIDK